MSKTILERMLSIYKKMNTDEDEALMPLVNIGKARSDLRALCKVLAMTPVQVVILTALVEKSSSYRIETNDIAEMLGLTNLEFMTYKKELDGLRQMGYIRVDTASEIVLPNEILESLQDDKPFQPPIPKGLTPPEVLDHIRAVLDIRSKDQCNTTEAVQKIETILDLNPGNSISRGCLKYRDVDTLERMLLYAMIVMYHRFDDDMICWNQLDDYFSEGEYDNIRGRFKGGCTNLQSRNVVEYTAVDGLVSKDFFHIRDEVKEVILADVGGVRVVPRNIAASLRVQAESIAPKRLFYNPHEERQVAQLRELLSESRFDGIRKRLKEKGLRSGFACLFHGGPGTGKTETVYQIARESGRDLFVIDVAKIKHCWVGESEKNIKNVFSQYRDCVASGGVTPILLFNEADAILGIRSEGAGSSVDKMENSIQNIILEEMENLDGIMIATTNLTQNLDPAFERRFLYKIRFGKPSVEARIRIWQSMIPELGGAEAETLASEFDFSGGQIENIARKRMINAIIDGEEPSFDRIKEYCSEETLGDGSSERARIGF